MKKIKLLSFLMVLLFSVPVSAEFYRYIDKDGKVRYTDDYGKVPKNQRSSAKEYSGHKNDSTNEATKSEAGSDPQSSSQLIQERKESQESEAVNTEKLDASKRRLDQKQKEINKELDDLNREKSELDALKEKVKTRPQTFEYKSKVEAFNDKVKSFTEKQKAFQAEAATYNNDVENSMKNTLEKYNKEKKEKTK